MPLLPLLLALSGAPEDVFKAWAVACDNVMRCQAVTLAPTAGETNAGDMVLTRDPGPAGTVSIEIWPARHSDGIVEIRIDRRLIGSGTMHSGTMKLSGGQAEGIARAMAKGGRLTLHAQGRTLAAISLSGTSASLRRIDERQGRAGGITALVARGPASAARVPGATALPRFAAVRAPAGKPGPIGAPMIRAMAERGGCDAEEGRPVGEQDAELFRLDSRSTLVLIACGTGAYNLNRAAFVVRGRNWTPARFEPVAIARDGKVGMVNHYRWDEGRLLGYDKGLGNGSCGSAEAWAWDGEAFRLIEASALGECRGSFGRYPTIYRAVPVWRRD